MTETNTNTSVVTPELTNNTASLPSPGAVLRLNRENSSLSQEEVSIALNVTVSKVKHLEADEFEKMHSEPFTRGYLRSYAKLLKIDGESLIACYDQYVGVSAAATTSENDNRGNDEIGSGTGLGKVLSIALLLFAAAWFFLEGLEGSAVDVDKAVAVSKVDDQRELYDEVVAVETVADDVSTDSATATELATEKPALVAVQAETATASVPALDRLKFVFTDECWVEVTDSSDDVLFADVKQSGEILQLQGVAPFNVILGNAGAVELTINDEPVNSRPKAGRKIMRFTVQALNEKQY
jgi:cytoskeleton protein RodZ